MLESKKCIECDTNNIPGAKYCKKCGFSFEKRNEQNKNELEDEKPNAALVANIYSSKSLISSTISIGITVLIFFLLHLVLKNESITYRVFFPDGGLLQKSIPFIVLVHRESEFSTFKISYFIIGALPQTPRFFQA